MNKLCWTFANAAKFQFSKNSISSSSFLHQTQSLINIDPHSALHIRQIKSKQISSSLKIRNYVLLHSTSIFSRICLKNFSLISNLSFYSCSSRLNSGAKKENSTEDEAIWEIHLLAFFIKFIGNGKSSCYAPHLSCRHIFFRSFAHDFGAFVFLRINDGKNGLREFCLIK